MVLHLCVCMYSGIENKDILVVGLISSCQSYIIAILSLGGTLHYIPLFPFLYENKMCQNKYLHTESAICYHCTAEITMA